MPWLKKNANEGDYLVPPRKILTDQVIEDLKAQKIVVSDAAPTIPGIQADDLCTFAMDGVWAVLAGDPDEAGCLPPELFPRAIRAAGFDSSASPVLCSVFWAIMADIEGPGSSALFLLEHKDPAMASVSSFPEADKLAEVVAACRRDKLVAEVDLLGTVDMRLLNQMNVSKELGKEGVIANRFYNMHIQRAVKLSQFNTFREEPEGYAKLLTLLHNSALATVADVGKVDKEVMQLVGYFSLNPMKVVYCTLCAVELAPANVKALLQLTPMQSGRWCLECIAIRMHYSRVSERGGSLGDRFAGMLALLLQAGRLKLSNVLALMADSIGSLSSAFASTHVGAADKEAQASEPSGFDSTWAGRYNLYLSKRDALLQEQIGLPPPVGLLLSMLRTSAWSECWPLWAYLQDKTGGQLGAHRALGMAALEHLHSALLGPHKAAVPNGSFGVCLTSSSELRARLPEALPLSDAVLQLLEELGPMVCRRTDTLMVLWRVLHHILLTHSSSESETRNRALQVLTQCAIPASCLLPPTPAIWRAASDLLLELPQLQRLQVYDEACNILDLAGGGRAGENRSLLSRLIAEHLRLIEGHLGRLQKTDSSASLVSNTPLTSAVRTLQPELVLLSRKLCCGGAHRLLCSQTSLSLLLPGSEAVWSVQEGQTSPFVYAKLFLAHPLGVARWMIGGAREATNKGDLNLGRLGALSPQLREFLFFECLRNLSLEDLKKEGSRLGSDGCNPDAWHSNLGHFLKGLVARCPQLDVSPLFRYVLAQLQECTALAQRKARAAVLDVTLPVDVLSAQLGPIIHDYDRPKLWIVLFLGPICRIFRSNDRTTPLLRDIQQNCDRIVRQLHPTTGEESLLVPLYISLCRHRARLWQNISAIGGTVQAFTMMQPVREGMLRALQLLHTLKTEELAALLPSIVELCNGCGLEKEEAMVLYRPVLRAALAQWRAPVDEPEEGQAAEDDAAMDDVPGEEGQVDSSGRSRVLLHDLVQQVHRLVPNLVPQSAIASDNGATPQPLFDPKFYILFWALEAPDIYRKTAAGYDAVTAEMKTVLAHTQKKVLDMRGEFEASEERRKKWEKERLKAMRENRDAEKPKTETTDTKLIDPKDMESEERALVLMQSFCEGVGAERKEFVERSLHWRAFVKARANHIFSTKHRGAGVHLLMQECILPRCIIGVEDALFCAHLLFTLADMNALNFSFASTVDKAYVELLTLLRCCSNKEALNLSIFLSELLKLIEDQNTQQWVESREMQAGKPMPKSQWDKLLNKHQKRMGSLLGTFCDLETFDRSVVKSALLSISQLCPQIPKGADAYNSLKAGLSRVYRQLHGLREDAPVPCFDKASGEGNAEERRGVPAELADIDSMLQTIMRKVYKQWKDSQGESSSDQRHGLAEVNLMEDGEVDSERGGMRAHDSGFKRRRDMEELDGRPHVRPRSGGELYGVRGGPLRHMPPYHPRGR